MKRKLLIILQARCSSRRLPGKVLKKINQLPLVVLCFKRLSNKGRRVIVATSNHKSDDKLVNLLKKFKIPYYRGSLNNVLSRYQKISKDLKPLKSNVTKNEYQKKIFDVKNEKIKKSLIELTKVFRQK